MPSSTRTIILLLLGSGFCGLVYQVTWMRMLRLVFGASTASSAAVLAIFMGGLGVGALWLGRWVERSRHPLRVYAHLEIGIALLVMLSPVLIWAVRFFYTSLGGTMVLGPFWGNALRLFLSALVLGFPAVLMGGTLPAAVRAAESAEDERRARVGLIYGANTLGAVFGAFLATFYLFEVFGARNTLWVACLLNLLIAMIARALSRNPIFEVAAEAPVQEATGPAEADVIDAETGGASAPIFFLLLASGVVGFVFFLMELVWYRMLGPILGGSTYSFGLILTMALSGIGVGGFCYGIFGTKRPSLWGFALTCVLEACFLGLPFFWGEQFALFASYL